MDSESTSLVDEGLRIARVYGLGADFESELEGLKKAASAATMAQEADTVAQEPEASLDADESEAVNDQKPVIS